MRVLEDAEAFGLKVAKAADAPSLPELRALSGEKLLEVGRGQRGMTWPIIDGWVIPDDQYKLSEARGFNDTPILVGNNSDEDASFSPPHMPHEYIANVRKRYGPFADRLLQAYPTGTNAVPKTARDLIRDTAFGWHTWVWARLQSERREGKVYYYYFDQHPEPPGGISRGRTWFPAWRRCPICVRAPGRHSPNCYFRGSADLRCDGSVLDQFRQARKTQRPGRSGLAGVERCESGW